MKIVILDGYTANPGDISWSLLEELGELVVYPQTTSQQLLSRAGDAEILVANKVPLDAAALRSLPTLKFISVLATGYDIVDTQAASEQGIVVSNVPEYSTQSVAQHVFTGLLSLLSRPEEHHQAILAGAWAQAGQFSFWNLTLTELAGKTMGIVGLGKIGTAVAKLAAAFGMQIAATSRRRVDNSGLNVKWLELDALFRESDFISLHCPATPETIKMVNRHLLAEMKPSAVLINTSRGGLVEEADLAQALNQDQLGGAFLDVVSIEPIIPTNPLLTAKNCLLTPHLGWATLESRQRLIQTTAENIAAFQAGTPIHRVN